MDRATQQALDRLYPFTPMDPMDTDYEVSWLMPGFLMEGKINIWFGAEKAGKSRLMSWVLPHLYSNSAIFGQPCQSPGRTLYMLGEETKPEVTKRLVEAQKRAGIPDGVVDWGGTIDFCEAAGMRLDLPKHRDWLRDRLSSGLYRTLIIDPLRRVHGAKESSNDAMAPICNELREWTNRYGLTLLIVHHTGKLGPDDDETRIATWSRGATDLPAVLDWALYVKRLPQQDRVRVLRQGRARPLGPLLLGDLDEGWKLLRTD
jgi:RecA-family ATPase